MFENPDRVDFVNIYYIDEYITGMGIVMNDQQELIKLGRASRKPEDVLHIPFTQNEMFLGFFGAADDMGLSQLGLIIHDKECS